MSPIPDMMRAARISDFNKPYKVEDVPVPSDLGPNDVLVKIRAAGFCHTDLQVMQGVYESAGAKPGLIGSHEPVGEVVKLGRNAGDINGLKQGDRVGSINTYGFCGRCSACKQGKQLCENLPGMLGLTLDGGFAQYMKADARVVAKVPDVIPWEEAAPLFCAGATIYGALLSIAPKPGQWLAIVGAGGGLGHLGVQYAKAMGAKVIAIDNRQEGIDVANDVPSHLRPDKSFVIDSEDAKNKVNEALNGSDIHDTNPGVDRIVIAAEARPLIKWSQQFLRKGGQLVDVGLPSDGPFEVDPFALNFKEQTVRGRLICTPEQCRDMLQLHASNKCHVRIEQTYKVDEINDMLDRYQSKELKGRLCMVF